MIKRFGNSFKGPSFEENSFEGNSFKGTNFEITSSFEGTNFIDTFAVTILEDTIFQRTCSLGLVAKVTSPKKPEKI